MADDDESHYLDSFLEERLPALGLDFETYGAYVTGLVTAMDDDDDDEADWEGILELLQASSESHSDDEEVWAALKEEILKLQAEQHQMLKQEEDQKKQERLNEEQERLQQDIALAKKAEEEAIENSLKPKEVDEAKQALVARYAYDESESYDKDGNLVAKAGEDKVMTNKDLAVQVTQEKSNAMRQNTGGGKKVEQEKTKKSMEDKKRQKEERRNRATKGERHRWEANEVFQFVDSAPYGKLHIQLWDDDIDIELNSCSMVRYFAVWSPCRVLESLPRCFRTYHSFR